MLKSTSFKEYVGGMSSLYDRRSVSPTSSQRRQQPDKTSVFDSNTEDSNSAYIIYTAFCMFGYMILTFLGFDRLLDRLGRKQRHPASSLRLGSGV